jgi:hypothetical protein
MFNGHFSTQWQLKQDYFICRRKISTLTNTGAGWTLCMLTILWSQSFLLWNSHNKAVHGHDDISSQNQARKWHLRRLEMEFLHEQHNKVLACDKHAFVGNTPADLNHFLDTSTASHVQNWIHIWKLRIIYSIQLAKELSLKGVCTLSSYFESTSAVTLRPINDRSHHTAWPRIRQARALPQPSFWFRNLRSFFAIPITAIAPIS